MDDTVITTRRLRRSRGSSENTETKPDKFECNNNDTDQQASRIRRSRPASGYTDTESSIDQTTTPTTVENVDNSQPRRRRSQRSSGELREDVKETPPPVLPKPKRSSGSEVSSPYTSPVHSPKKIDIPTSNVRESASVFENIAQKMAPEETEEDDIIEEEYEEDDDDVSEGKEQVEFLLDNLRHHMESFEPFGQRDVNADFDEQDEIEIKEEKRMNMPVTTSPRVEKPVVKEKQQPPTFNRGVKQREKPSFASGGQQPQVNHQETVQSQASSSQQQRQAPSQAARQRAPPQASQQSVSAAILSDPEPYSPLKAQLLTMSMRAPRSGDMFHNEMKMEKRYEEEEKLGTPQRVLQWICTALQQQAPAPNGTDWKAIQMYLRDGVILCKLVNRLLKTASMEPIGYRQKVNSAFVALNNLENFIVGAKRYGVPETSFFQPSDLYEGRKGHLLAVVNCLNALGCVANARGFTPAYKEPAPPKADWCKEECYD